MMSLFHFLISLHHAPEPCCRCLSLSVDSHSTRSSCRYHYPLWVLALSARNSTGTTSEHGGVPQHDCGASCKVHFTRLYGAVLCAILLTIKQRIANWNRTKDSQRIYPSSCCLWIGWDVAHPTSVSHLQATHSNPSISCSSYIRSPAKQRSSASD